MTSMKSFIVPIIIDMFSISSCTATIRLVHNGGHMRKLLKLLNSPEIMCFGRMYLVTKVLLNLYQFYSILATIQYFKLWKSAIMNQFHKRVYSFRISVQLQNPKA